MNRDINSTSMCATIEPEGGDITERMFLQELSSDQDDGLFPWRFVFGAGKPDLLCRNSMIIHVRRKTRKPGVMLESEVPKSKVQICHCMTSVQA